MTNLDVSVKMDSIEELIPLIWPVDMSVGHFFKLLIDVGHPTSWHVVLGGIRKAS